MIFHRTTTGATKIFRLAWLLEWKIKSLSCNNVYQVDTATSWLWNWMIWLNKLIWYHFVGYFGPIDAQPWGQSLQTLLGLTKALVRSSGRQKRLISQIINISIKSSSLNFVTLFFVTWLWWERACLNCAYRRGHWPQTEPSDWLTHSDLEFADLWAFCKIVTICFD